jgi:hypothetical protein
MGSWKYVAAAAALAATPLTAQDAPQQTVEGAQEFLRRISTQYSMANGALTSGDYYFAYKDIRFEAESACVSNIGSELIWRYTSNQSIPGLSNDENFERYKIAASNNYANMDAAAKAKWIASMEAARFRTSVDWASVSSVQKVSAKTYGAPDDVKRAILVNAQPAFVLFAPDEALATRIAYAMEFLRAACDLSAETGF